VFRRKRVRARWIRMGIALFVGVAIGVIAINTSKYREGGLTHFEMGNQSGPLTAVYWVKSSVAHTGLRSSDIVGLADGPDSDPLIAKAILAAMPQRSKPDGYLGIELTPTAIVANGRQRSFGRWLQVVSYSEYQLTARPDLGQAGFVANPQPGGLHLTRYGSIEFIQVPDDPALLTRQWSFSLPSAGILAILLWLIWLLSVAACRLTHRLMMRYRRRRGRCVACGYQLGPP